MKRFIGNLIIRSNIGMCSHYLLINNNIKYDIVGKHFISYKLRHLCIKYHQVYRVYYKISYGPTRSHILITKENPSSSREYIRAGGKYI